MNDALHELVAAQHGLISRRQALQTGMTAGSWTWLTRSNDWKRVSAGVYRRVGAPQTWNQALMAGCLAGDGIASHRAAGVLWNLPKIEPRLEITFEAQSYEHHSTLEAFAADVERNLELFGEGWMIVPITAVQLRDPPRLVGLMARIIAAAEARPPRLNRRGG